MKFKRFLSVLLALAMVLSMTLLSAGAALTATRNETMETCFPNEAFRDAVISAYNDDKPNGFTDKLTKTTPSGQGLVDALAAFKGTVNAHNQGITDAHGIEYLRNAELINLSKNKITDLEFLWSITGGAEDYYGSGPLFGEGATNVEWNLGGNPFTKLPSNFGGHLVIDQPATTASVYDETNFRPRVYLCGSEPDSQVFNITRCEVYDNDLSDYRWVHVVNRPNPIGDSILTLGECADDIRLPFSDVKKSGIQTIGLGIDQEVHYMTADEYTTITPGSQSFKYYIHPQFFVYDTVTVGYEDSVTLIKTDADTHEPLAGAQYELRKEGSDTLLGTYTTDEKGLLVIADKNVLLLGNFTLKEIKAPNGYDKDSDPIEFTLQSGSAKVKLTGGVTSIQTTTDVDNPAGPSIEADGAPKVALNDPNTPQVFIAGPKDVPLGKPEIDGGAAGVYVAEASPDIGLEFDGDTKAVTAHVIYSALEVLDKEGKVDEREDISRVFATLAEAALDINREKNDNHILGPVAINISVTGLNAIHLEHTNKKTPPPSTPSVPTVSVKGQKIWEDDDNSGDTRPTSIKVELYRDGEPYKTTTVTAANNWKYSFTGLTKSHGNTHYDYTVREGDVPEGYTSAVHSATGSTGNTVTTTITNTLMPPEEPPAEPTEPTEPTEPVDPNTPGNPGEPPATPPVAPDEPPTTLPGEPGEPAETLPTVPPTTPNLPQTGTVNGAAASHMAVSALFAGLAALFAAAAVFLWRKRGNSDA